MPWMVDMEVYVDWWEVTFRRKRPYSRLWSVSYVHQHCNSHFHQLLCFTVPVKSLFSTRLLVHFQVPQMILLTFDDAINSENWDIYTQHLFTPGRKNANSCPIRGTFYVSHQYTNYQQTQKLWNDGHEIAVHSVT